MVLSHLAISVATLDSDAEIAALGRCPHQSLVIRQRNGEVLIDPAMMKLDFQDGGFRVVANRPEIG